jgi:hypothetical protein
MYAAKLVSGKQNILRRRRILKKEPPDEGGSFVQFVLLRNV